MELNKRDRLIIANQLKILEALYPEEAEHYAIQRQAIEEGYALQYDEVANMIFDELPEEDCREVLDILNMYRAITFSYQQLENKDGLETSEIEFPGFDGNAETKQFVYTQYFVMVLGRFQELRREEEHFDFNSHMQSLGKYRRMLDRWNDYSEKFQLSAQQIRELLAV